MSRPEFDRVRALFDAARGLAPADRDHLLRTRCVNDPELLTEVRSLLRHDDAIGEFLVPPTPEARPPGPGDAVAGRYLAVEKLGNANLDGLVTLTEAAAAWRAGDDAVAAEFAGRAAARFEEIGQREGAALARALRLVARGGAEVDPAGADALLVFAAGSRVPGVKMQIAGLVARASPARKERCRELALEAARELPDEEWDRRREVLSPAEAGEFVE